ncbi:MAG: MoxR family ATPase [Lachnospiraceae bacterium]|nr:MoxR family ATPase [Lachnospiraceae bacterium]
MLNRLREAIESYFIGKPEVIENMIVCLIAGGHVLLEDVPGVGKTTLAKTIAAALDCSFGRIQFTPDTLPGDVVGLSVFNMKTGEFEYREGAIMKQIILADEINRTSPKTQSALLEAMAEGQVSVDGRIFKLPEPFMVIATQNPVEFLGTYPLPEAQVDRFMMKLSLGYPSEDMEKMLARNMLAGKTLDDVSPVCGGEDVMRLKKEAASVHVSPRLIDYMSGIVARTRQEKRFALGASPRAFLDLTKASQARALISGRDFVIPDDVKAVALNTLHHRIVLTPEAKIGHEDVDQILPSLILTDAVPMA